MSTPTLNTSIRRRKARGPKSRNGCITCKIRHAKCGEEKPECNECIRTGRKCDGYTNASQKQLQEQIRVVLPQSRKCAPEGQLVLFPGTRQERQYVHLFCTHATKNLAGFFSSEIWGQLIPQLSQRNPTIRHAVVAVGALYEQQWQGRLLPAAVQSEQSDTFALDQYNKAIEKCLVEMSTQQESTVNLILVACLLFVCVEMLRKNNDRALDHVQAGLQILSRRVQEDRMNAENKLERELTQLFHRLNIQLAFFGRTMVTMPIPTEKSTRLPPGEKLTFQNIFQARESLTSVINRGLTWLRQVGIERVVPPEDILAKQLEQQRMLSDEIEVWYTAFKALLNKSVRTAGITDQRGPLSLLIQHRVSKIWVATSICREELAYDHFLPDFEFLISSAEKVVELSRAALSSGVQEDFTLDAGLMPPLYWAACRCRWPLLRRRAIQVLLDYPSREGMWDRHRHVTAAQRIVEIEEAAYSHLPFEERIPMDCHRVYEALMLPEQEPSSNSCAVLFMFKPHGVDAEWEKQMDRLHW